MQLSRIALSSLERCKCIAITVFPVEFGSLIIKMQMNAIWTSETEVDISIVPQTPMRLVCPINASTFEQNMPIIS